MSIYFDAMTLKYGERFSDGPEEWMMYCASEIVGKDSPVLEIFCYFWHEVIFEFEGVIEKRKKEKKQNKKIYKNKI